MDTLLDELCSRRLVFVTGKGGVGKTVFAAALAQRAVEAGLRVTLVEASAAGQLAALLGVELPIHQEVRLAPGFSAINLDPSQCFREYVVKYLGQKGLYERVFSHQLVHTFINTVPGFAELMLLGRLFYAAELAPEPRPDVVIFDCFASGHFLSLMTTPDAVLDAGFGGPLARETERVKAFMKDPAKCGVAYVAAAEALVVNETLEFLPKLSAQSPAKVAAVVVNRVPPSLLAAGDVDGAAAGQGDASWASFGAGEGVAQTLASARRHQAQASLRQLQEARASMAHSQAKLPFILLPDLGAICEPWPRDFGRSFLDQARSLEVMRGL